MVKWLSWVVKLENVENSLCEVSSLPTPVFLQKQQKNSAITSKDSWHRQCYQEQIMPDWLNLFYILGYIYHKQESKSQGLSLVVIINHHFKLYHIHMTLNFLLDYQKFMSVVSEVCPFKDRQKGITFNCSQCSVLHKSPLFSASSRVWHFSKTFFKNHQNTTHNKINPPVAHFFTFLKILIIILLLYVHSQKSRLYVILSGFQDIYLWNCKVNQQFSKITPRN